MPNRNRKEWEITFHASDSLREHLKELEFMIEKSNLKHKLSETLQINKESKDVVKI